MRGFTAKTKLAAVGLVAAACFGLWGCPNPNAIGVQQYGIVKATCLQVSNNQPVSGAIVSVAGQSNATPTDATGAATIPNVPIGTHQILADAPGLHGESSVNVVENQTVSVTISMSPQ